jgi:hypothetical protein
MDMKDIELGIDKEKIRKEAAKKIEETQKISLSLFDHFAEGKVRLPGAPRADGADIDDLLKQLEKFNGKLGPAEKKSEEEMDDFTRWKKLAARQVAEIRKLLSERDECLEASSGSSGRQSVMLSAQIREQLKNVKDTHGKMQSAVYEEEKERDKGDKKLLEASGDTIDEHHRIVELTAKHIEECESLEKRRYQTGGGAWGGGGRPGLVTGGAAMGAKGGAHGGGGGAGTHPMKDMKRSIEAPSDLDPIDADSEIGQGLAQVCGCVGVWLCACVRVCVCAYVCVPRKHDRALPSSPPPPPPPLSLWVGVMSRLL